MGLNVISVHEKPREGESAFLLGHRRLFGVIQTVRVLGGDTECPLQVYQLNRSSESTHFLSLGRDVAFY